LSIPTSFINPAYLFYAFFSKHFLLWEGAAGQLFMMGALTEKSAPEYSVKILLRKAKYGLVGPFLQNQAAIRTQIKAYFST
jgi:hypothetical protein